ncbi:MAG: S49 family peptidase [Rubrivivax sp.]|jgi:protease-4|nr:S49 family peptidase [Rubrivivax sp.]MCZ8174744.1 S49 family peptidase [Burkholderiaceae bacterium]
MNPPEPSPPPAGPAPAPEPLSVTAAAALADQRAAAKAAPSAAPGLEAAVERLGAQWLAHQRSERRWRLFFRFVWLLVLLVILVLSFGNLGRPSAPTTPHTALVEVRGEIALDTEASADRLIAGLRDAFKDAGAQAVVLRINSPGGSPVQAGIVHDEILRLKALHGKKVYAVVEEVGASGAYYIAVAADQIFVDKASIVGSIGVLMNGFGFTGLMDKLGVERRLITAGSNKAMLDPFSPLDPKQKELAQAMLVQIHQQFIDVVRKGRGERLKAGDETFSGLVWNGEEAVKNGLADALGSLDYVAREVVKAEDIVDYTARENVAERLAKRFGAEVGAGAVRALRSQGAFGSADGGAPLQ